MSIHFDILIDASGSMGYMQGAGQEHENKYLLPDGSTRTDLVKKILTNSIIPKLSFTESIHVIGFRNIKKLNNQGKPVVVDNKYVEKPINQDYYKGKFDKLKLNEVITKINNPEPGGTPLFWSISTIINQKDRDSFNIIVLSDGDANDNEKFDEEILQQITKENIKCKIYFIGIDQDEEAKRKSKNLADNTGGIYVNLEVINYDEKVFDSFLFEWNAAITSNALKEKLKIESAEEKTSPIETKSKVANQQIIPTKEELVTNNSANTHMIETAEPKKAVEETIDLEVQVLENTKALQLITSQLDSIVKEISFIRKSKLTDEDEFIDNEDEDLNKAIGYNCEKYLNSYFKQQKWEKVEWLNETNESGFPYDFKIIDEGVTYFIECKGTTTDSKEFFLTRKEWLFYLQNRKNYRLYFIYDLTKEGIAFIRIEDLLKDMEEGKLIPCSSVNRKVKADRILFQIIN